MESEPKRQSAIEFAKEKLSLNPEASFAELKAQAKFEGISLFPVVYGRAKALLGLVPTAPYGSKSKARKQALEEASAERFASRDKADVNGGDREEEEAASTGPRTKRAKAAAAGEGDPTSALEEIVNNLKTVVRERDRFRSTLEKIADLVQSELRKP